MIELISLPPPLCRLEVIPRLVRAIMVIPNAGSAAV